MCDDCEYEGGTRAEGIQARLVPAARKIEAAMPGDCASDEAWMIFSGRAGGGVSFVDLQRMLSSYQAAERADNMVLGRKRRTARPRCEAAAFRAAAV
jgi:hypothetical protein